MTRTEKRWRDEFRRREAFWIHDGNIQRPHAKLTTGMHSGGYFNSESITGDINLMIEVANDFMTLLSLERFDVGQVQVVVGPQKGGRVLAEYLSEEIAFFTHFVCNFASPEKGEKEGERIMVLDKEEQSLLKGQTVLLCDDVFTTGDSIKRVEEAVVRAEGIILPYILVLVNRSGKNVFGDKKIISLVSHFMPLWRPEECELCKKGSRALPAKANWALLNQEY
jgi:orotate phosphoribosyltransferase